MIKNMQLLVYVLIFEAIFGYCSIKSQEVWTHLFRKIISGEEAYTYAQRSELIFSRHATPLFNQLIFSWNAFRPTEGHFSFFVQVRDARTKKWCKWHAMADWGVALQRSYFNSHSDGTAYHHVRLEVPLKTMSDAFRIKAVAHQGASLGQLKALIVNIANFNNFKVLDNCSEIDDLSLPSIIISRVPCQSQMILDHVRAEHMCSPTALSMLLGFIQMQPVDALATALKVYDAGLDTFGSWPFNIAHAFDVCKGAFLFYTARLHSFPSLHTFLMRKIPVIVSVRGPLLGGAREYAHGHLVLVVGWNAQSQEVICHDPAFESSNNVIVSYKIKDFCAAWARSHNLAYIAEIY